MAKKKMGGVEWIDVLINSFYFMFWVAYIIIWKNVDANIFLAFSVLAVIVSVFSLFSKSFPKISYSAKSLFMIAGFLLSFFLWFAIAKAFPSALDVTESGQFFENIVPVEWLTYFLQVWMIPFTETALFGIFLIFGERASKHLAKDKKKFRFSLILFTFIISFVISLWHVQTAIVLQESIGEETAGFISLVLMNQVISFFAMGIVFLQFGLPAAIGMHMMKNLMWIASVYKRLANPFIILTLIGVIVIAVSLQYVKKEKVFASEF